MPLAKSFSSDVRCIAVRCSGRSGAHDLASFTSIPDLAESACRLLASAHQGDGNVALFGHSMGALVAFDVARRFEAAGMPVAALFVSACAAPGEIGHDYIPESDRGLLDAVGAMTGETLSSWRTKNSRPSFCPHFADSRPSQITSARPMRRCHAPFSLFLGDDDEVATYEKVTRWSQRTTSEFSARVFPGHHFYLNDHLPELVSDIEDKVALCCGG